MMTEKESGDINKNAFGSVWKVINPYGSIKYRNFLPIDKIFCLTRYRANLVYVIRYKNTITGSVQTDFPKLCHGGILADVGLLTTFQLPGVLRQYTGYGPG